MARGLFGRKKDAQPADGVIEWPRLPGTAPPPEPSPAPGQSLEPRAVAYAHSVIAAPATTPEKELLQSVSDLRNTVADRLFAMSTDYQILSNLMHENIEACHETVGELRRRLAGNLHYTVLGRLDELHALVQAQADPERRSEPTT
jgi:hypothetical protein